MTGAQAPAPRAQADRRPVVIAALALGLALLAPLALSALRGPPPGPAAPATTTAPAPDAPDERPRVLHIAAGSASGEALLTLDGADFGRVTRDPQDGAVRGEGLLRISAATSSLAPFHIEITRDPSVPVELADGIQRMLASGGAIDTRVVEPPTSRGALREASEGRSE